MLAEACGIVRDGEREREFICQTRNKIYVQIANKCDRLPEKAWARQSWPPIARTNNSVCNITKYETRSG